jgi:hypothetical protein
MKKLEIRKLPSETYQIWNREMDVYTSDVYGKYATFTSLSTLGVYYTSPAKLKEHMKMLKKQGYEIDSSLFKTIEVVSLNDDTTNNVFKNQEGKYLYTINKHGCHFSDREIDAIIVERMYAVRYMLRYLYEQWDFNIINGESYHINSGDVIEVLHDKN